MMVFPFLFLNPHIVSPCSFYEFSTMKKGKNPSFPCHKVKKKKSMFSRTIERNFSRWNISFVFSFVGFMTIYFDWSKNGLLV